MSDSRSFDRLSDEVAEFARERGWDSQATAKDLAAAIAIEAGELQELLLWTAAGEEGDVLRARAEDFAEELADVVIYAIRFAGHTGIDLPAAIAAKLRLNATRFPPSAD